MKKGGGGEEEEEEEKTHQTISNCPSSGPNILKDIVLMFVNRID